MDIRILKYYITAAREENITKAASLLHLTQPTLSRQLHLLEEEMNTKLFYRGRHSIILTDKGKLFLERAKEIVALYEATQEELVKREEELSGEVKIGCGETKGMEYLTRQIVEFKKIYPLVCFKIYSLTADRIKKDLEKGFLNLGLMTEPVEVDKYQYMRMNEYDRWGIMVHKDSPLAQKEAVTRTDLIGEPLILPVREKVRGELASWFGEYSDLIHVSATCNLVLNEVMMVKNGMGTAICLELPVADEMIRFIPLSPELKTGSVLVWNQEQSENLAAIQFIKFVRNAK